MPLALAALLRTADATGAARFRDLAVAYREDYLELQRLEWGEVVRQRGALSVDEVRRHLQASVLPRLTSEAIVDLLPDSIDDDERIRLRPAVWNQYAPERESARDRLFQLALQLVRASEAVGARTVPIGSTLVGKGLTKAYRRRRVVDNVHLELHQGEIVGLLGPNGAGKTTTFYMIVGLVRPEAGRIYLDGEDISVLPMYRRARRGIGYLAQEPSVFRKLTVQENVMAILETLPLSPAERWERLETLLDDLSIKHLRDTRAYKLSGGERRRLEITRALVTEPKFLLLDEPFTGVDPIAVSDIQTIVAGLRRRGIGVLITDHNVEQTLDIVDRAYIMFEGKVQVSGTVRELVFNEQVADLYLGPTLTARLRERLGAMV
ncbi:MAG: LPS export ABC transporter ATP-binding protein [Gemmatimonadales bacterium]|nr:LPS export ABC transporter ATP-binding protein [Gemmatimonadales bacterium]NIN11637.1 LPS export ABC transporter ATP-binding protein [Gemmatimonadales bacterium]NIN50243.1 LPS export ABC transporter ATP-binding protein [Gemmatimonadales bacterium]NIP07707.1 LPS export ABC transporter ATP-binding protein [Gemmatimonadales bacterium]NIR01859.1 LPS export ABC transporter ATP-binding protein [Gemmatimonadales bacterium]